MKCIEALKDDKKATRKMTRAVRGALGKVDNALEGLDMCPACRIVILMDAVTFTAKQEDVDPVALIAAAVTAIRNHYKGVQIVTEAGDMSNIKVH